MFYDFLMERNVSDSNLQLILFDGQTKNIVPSIVQQTENYTLLINIDYLDHWMEWKNK